MNRRERLDAWHRRLVAQGPETFTDRCLFVLLVVPALAYGLLLWLREKLFLGGFLPRYRAPVPVISVGNLTVGGTGKTPLSDLLIAFLRERGYTPAVVSRGYGREVSAPVETVCSGSGPQLPPNRAGDEPYLLARRNPESIVVVAARRAAGIHEAIRLGADIVLLDDGFQHLAVVRDLDLVLLDAGQPLGNGLPLPAGLLREFPSALTRASAFVLTRSPRSCSGPLSLSGKPALTTAHRLADAGWDLSGTTWRIEDLRGKKVHAFSGIATPENFFTALAQRHIDVQETLAFPDHVCYDRAELEQLLVLARDIDLLVTTEKDAVKLLEAELPCPCVAIPLEITVHAGDAGLDALVARFLPDKEELTMTLSPELLEILACPVCKKAVDYEDVKQRIVCRECRPAYPVRDDIPVMLTDEAQRLDD